MKKYLFDCGTRDATASLGFFALRVLVGLMMLLGHGIPKMKNYQIRKDLFYVPDFFPFNLVTPQISLLSCIAAEVGAAALIIIGLATRPAAFVLGLCMVVAAFGFLNGAPWFVNSATLVDTKELSVMYLIAMIAMILGGAGKYSFDAWIYKDSKRRRW
jgi:putative oxidoreductase